MGSVDLYASPIVSFVVVTVVEKGVDTLFLRAHHVILYWNKSLWYLNFVKLYVYIMNI